MKKVIMTVDVEGHVGKDPVAHLIMGESVDGSRYGIDKLMDIFDYHHIKGLFFVDIAEAWDYGEAEIATVLRYIKGRGHDCGVHIHPDHMADVKRLFLWEYTKDEQRKIIKKCTDFYIRILGEKPKAFRAGKYGANHDTLDVLAENGYLCDFSEFVGQRWCQIEPPVAYSKVTRLKTGLLEFPVTSYRSFTLGAYSRNDKLDANMAMNEFRYLVRRLVLEDCVNPVIMFAHSFSLLNWRKTPDAPKVNRRNVKKLDMMLSILRSEPNLTFVSLDELLVQSIVSEDICETMMSITGFSSWLFFMQRAYSIMKMRIETKVWNMKNVKK
mgnify:FL=1